MLFKLLSNMKKHILIFLIFVFLIRITYGLGEGFNVAVSIGYDSDGDGIVDSIDPDDDNDGILDANDCVTGNSSFVSSNTITPNATVNDQTNLSQVFTGNVTVKIMDSSTPRVEFEYDCSLGRLNLANVTIAKQTDVSAGSLLVRGLSLVSQGRTKTVYVDDIISSNTLCIKDKEISSISEISSNCGGVDEVSITCPGTAGSYICTVMGSQYKVEGLQNSGVKEYSPGGSTSSGGGGGGGAAVVQPTISEKKSEFSVQPNFIKISMEQGEKKSQTLEIKNTGDTPLDINMEVSLISKYLSLSEEHFSLEPGSSKTITLDISVVENELPDSYIGRIIVYEGGMTKLINVIIEVKEKNSIFDIKTEVIKKSIRPMGDVRAKISVLKPLDIRPLNISLYYAIKDIRGNVLVSKEEQVSIDRKSYIERSLSMPEEYSCTDYVFYSMATYNGKKASSTDIFTILCQENWLTSMSKTGGAAWGIGKEGGYSFALLLLVFIVTILFVVLYTTINYNQMRSFVMSKYGRLVGEDAAKIEAIEKTWTIRKQIQAFEKLQNGLEESLGKSDFEKAKKLYSKLNQIYIDLNEKSISKDKKVQMYAALTRGFGRFMEQQKRGLPTKDANFEKETHNFEELMKQLEGYLKNHEFSKAKRIYSRLSQIYVDLNERSISKDKKIQMYAALTKQFGKFMEERKKELEKYSRTIQQLDKKKVAKGDNSSENKAEKKFRELVEKLEQNLKSREFLKAKQLYTELNKVYSDLNEQALSDEKKIKMYAVLIREHDKLVKGANRSK